MKQLFQNLADGVTEVVDIPCPEARDGEVLIASTASLVSIGTERMLVEFSKAGLVGKAMSQPEKVKQVFEKSKTDGVLATADAVRSKLNQPLPLGYCNVGIVTDGGSTDLAVGTRVVSNGPHAEVVSVPRNLVVKIPSEVDNTTASFTVLGAIALQGIRLINPTLGENVVVFGLGIIGLLAVQILRANGCRVLGVDIDPVKCNLAKTYGAEVVDISVGDDPVEAAARFSRGRGVDAVLITASSKSSDIVRQAATMSRKRGRLVLVGVVGLELNRQGEGAD